MHYVCIYTGIGLQLTNILRDVGEDLERGRIYLPLGQYSVYVYMCMIFTHAYSVYICVYLRWYTLASVYMSLVCYNNTYIFYALNTYAFIPNYTILPHFIYTCTILIYYVYTTIYLTLYIYRRVEGLWYQRGRPVPVQGDRQV